LITVIAAVACLAASPVAFATEPSSAATVITGWATLYAAPLILIFARGVRVARAGKIAATIIVCGLPVVGFFAFFHLLIAPLVALLVGWIALMAVALFPSTLGKLVDEMYAAAPVRGGEPELPPLVYEPKWFQPVKTETTTFWNGHWIGFLFLLPFVVMYVIRELLGMSTAYVAGGTTWDEFSVEYTLNMLASLRLGSLAFVIYTLAMPVIKGRGWRWVIPKLVFLVFYWLFGRYLVSSMC